MTIVAPPEVIHTWQEESSRLLAAARRDGLPSTVVEVLNHAAGIFLMSAINATPGAPALFRSGLKRLVDEVTREQAAGGDPGTVCPVPMEDGLPFACGCGEQGRRTCADAAFDAGAGELDLGGGRVS